MNNVPFKMIIEDLNCGREIEFAYHGKKYSITNSEGYWNFCCDTDGIIIERLCPFNDKTKLIERVSNLNVEGVLLSTIFDKTSLSKIGYASRISWGNTRGQHPNDAALLPHSTLGHFVSKLIGTGFIMVLGFFQRFEIKYIMKLTNNPPDVLVRKSTVLHRIDHISPAGVVAPRLGHHSGQRRIKCHVLFLLVLEI